VPCSPHCLYNSIPTHINWQWVYLLGLQPERQTGHIARWPSRAEKLCYKHWSYLWQTRLQLSHAHVGYLLIRLRTVGSLWKCPGVEKCVKYRIYAQSFNTLLEYRRRQSKTLILKLFLKKVFCSITVIVAKHENNTSLKCKGANIRKLHKYYGLERHVYKCVSWPRLQRVMLFKSKKFYLRFYSLDDRDSRVLI